MPRRPSATADVADRQMLPPGARRKVPDSGASARLDALGATNDNN
jgi:hypothetical protein